LFIISKGIFDQISIPLKFIISTPEFESAFGKANFWFSFALCYTNIFNNLKKLI